MLKGKIMVTTYELKIHGKIPHVGFREKIENLGHALDIDGIVYNYEDDIVRILANFDDEELKEFLKKSIKFLEKKDDLIKIDEIEEKELNAYIEFPKGINRISADNLLELNKKLDEGVKYVKLIFGKLEEHKEILTDINSGMGNLNSGMGNLNKKMDDLIDILKNK
ncbi:MAG: acylphosphatase [Methanosarcinaceae archaeon]|jgi:acylphosphatase|nr:acylphosphatase [Methanosarcinaceae archaeon]